MIGLSDADIAIFGGDLNASPILEPHHPYGMMRTLMKDSLTEKFPSASLHPAFATFGNADNTYTHNSIPERIDYLMFRAKNHIDMKVRNCFYLAKLTSKLNFSCYILIYSFFNFLQSSQIYPDIRLSYIVSILLI